MPGRADRDAAGGARKLCMPKKVQDRPTANALLAPLAMFGGAFRQLVVVGTERCPGAVRVGLCRLAFAVRSGVIGLNRISTYPSFLTSVFLAALLNC